MSNADFDFNADELHPREFIHNGIKYSTIGLTTDDVTLEMLRPNPLIVRIIAMNERVLKMNNKLLDMLVSPQYIMRKSE